MAGRSRDRAVDSLTRIIDEGKLANVHLAIILTPNLVNSDWIQRDVEIALNQEIAGNHLNSCHYSIQKLRRNSGIHGK